MVTQCRTVICNFQQSQETKVQISVLVLTFTELCHGSVVWKPDDMNLFLLEAKPCVIMKVFLFFLNDKSFFKSIRKTKHQKDVPLLPNAKSFAPTSFLRWDILSTTIIFGVYKTTFNYKTSKSLKPPTLKNCFVTCLFIGVEYCWFSFFIREIKPKNHFPVNNLVWDWMQQWVCRGAIPLLKWKGKLVYIGDQWHVSKCHRGLWGEIQKRKWAEVEPNAIQPVLFGTIRWGEKKNV